MIKRTIERYSKADVLRSLDPLISDWFHGRFADLTQPQSMAIPLIEARKNVLVSSPTGSGKTLTAFLSIIDRLYKLQKEGQLQDRIYAVYVSPLKALANDINKNLLSPLSELTQLAKERGVDAPKIRVAVRTGDTSSSERQRQATKSPHIFITTPESLSLVLSTPKFRTKFNRVEYVIVDEIHEICDSKRGVALSLSLERLQAEAPSEIARIGLSATQAPIEEIGKFLVGRNDSDWRDLLIAEVEGQKDLDLRVLCPADDMTALPFEIVNSKMYDLLAKIIAEHTTTLIFTNTRSATEHVVFKLRERGVNDIEAHHGSMSKESRIGVEDNLKDGKLKAVVSSTSLELGIDIGSIDLVCQIGSPKAVAKALQRIGRSGHEVGKTSQGRLIAFDNDDLVECAVLCRAAHRKHIDRVSIPKNNLDVLAQTIVGMSLERKWRMDEAYSLVRRSYCYSDLPLEEFKKVIDFLSGKEGQQGIYSKIWFDEADNSIGMKRGSRLIYYLNQGTIPEESAYKVFSEKGAPIGDLSEKFVERLSRGDIFVLGGRSYEFIRSRGTKVFVKHAMGRKPTVPSWTGEMLPRSFDLSVEIGKFRGEFEIRLQEHTDEENLEWLRQEFDIDGGSAKSLLNYFKEQKAVAGIPNDKKLLIEGYRDEEGKSNIVFHFPFGRRVNDALSRAYAFKMSNRFGFNSTISVTDDCFMIVAPKPIKLDEIKNLLSSEELERLLRSSLKDTELLSQRFRHCATRGLMILRNYRGRELSISRQQMRSKRLLEVLGGDESFPIISEAYSEILNDVFDLEHAREVVASIETGERELATYGYGDAPSPFSHNVLLAGISDVVLMEDRSALLRQLHRKVLAKVLGAEAMAEYKFEEEKVDSYFKSKFKPVSKKDDLIALLEHTGPIHLFSDKGINASAIAGLPLETIRAFSEELLKEGKIRSVWLSDTHWVSSADRDEVAIALDPGGEPSEMEKKATGILADQKSVSEAAEGLAVTKDEAIELLHSLERRFSAERVSISRNAFKWKAIAGAYGDREHARCVLVERHLAAFGPSTLQELAFHFHLSEEDVKSALRQLESDGKAVSGRFVIGDDVQYMLANDYVSLSHEGQTVFDEELIRQYQVAKQFKGIESFSDYLERFGEAGMLLDVYQRCPRLDIDGWISHRASGKILNGRFLRGRVRYVRSEDAPYFVSLYREEEPTDFDNSVLREIDILGEASIFDLEKSLGEDRDRIRGALDRLDQNMYIVRKYTEGEDWSGVNIYQTFDGESRDEGAEEWIIRKFLASHGPASLQAIRSYTGLDVERILPIIGGGGIGKVLTGLSGMELYSLQEDIEELKSFEPSSDRTRILSLYDPLLETRWAELSSRFGEGWYFPVVRDGIIVGVTEIWPLSSCIEVREVSLDRQDAKSINEFLGALDSFASFFSFYGIDIVRIRSVFGKDVTQIEPEISSLLRKAGYRMLNGMMVKGEVTDRSYSDQSIMSHVFSKQHLSPAKQYKSVTMAMRSMGGLRSEIEGVLRSKSTADSKIGKSDSVYKGIGIPPFLMHMSMAQASMYRAAKDAYIDEEMESTLKVISSNLPLTKDFILEQSPLGPTEAAEALRRLYQKTLIVLDGQGKYHAVPRLAGGAFEARRAVVKKAFEMFGIFSAEGLSQYMHHSFGMRDLRRALRSLVEEGLLVRGYIRPNDETLYWIISSEVDKISKAKFSESFVLAPQDRLLIYLRDGWGKRFGETGQYIVFDGIEPCGKFKARIDKHDVEILGFEGSDKASRIMKAFVSRMGKVVQKEEKRLSEWEIADFFERTNMFAKD